MSKSRYSKTKASGMLCGMSRCKDYSFKQSGFTGSWETPNRQMRRLRDKESREAQLGGGKK